MRKYHFRQFAATRLFYPIVRYSPDGKQIGHISNTTGQYNLWTIPSGGGFARQLTCCSDETVRNFRWSPGNRQIALQIDRSGDELFQIYLLPDTGGWAAPITNAQKARHFLAGFSPDGKYLSYACNDRAASEMDVVIYELASGQTRRPMPTGREFYPSFWSPDGSRLLVTEFLTNTIQKIHVLNVESGGIIEAIPHEGLFIPGPWANDGGGFYFRSSYQREFLGIGFYDLAENKLDFIETPDNDVEHIVISKNNVLVWSVNENGSSKLYGRDLSSEKDLEMPDLPLCVVGDLDISPDGRRLAMIMARPTEASNLYEIDLETGKIEALSQSMLGGIDPEDLSEPSLVFYSTFDERQIPAWLYRPRGEGKFPVVLSIHGGPEAQERAQYNYNGMYQYLLSRGIGVLAPNIRGSTGYGLTFQKLIYRDWGGDELKDIEFAAKFLRSLEWVDAERIAIYGGSFGGFAVLGALSRLPEYWACGVDIVGPSNLVTFAQSVPPFWQSAIKQLVGDPSEDREMLLERSPITYVGQIRAPLLVIQGAKDPRVVKAESDQMVEQIRKNGGEVEYYVDENEGHGATRRENLIRWMEMVCDYLVSRLKS